MPRVWSTILLPGALLLAAACTAAPPGAPSAGHPLTPGPPPGAPAGPVALALPSSGLTEDQRIVHALNRLAYGPRPGDVERVRRLGLRKWVERQLSPESIPDDTVEARLRDLSTLPMSTPELLRQYPPPETARPEGKPGAGPAPMR